ncbi:MAG: hypothetical protein O7D91_12230 [Planctomycetota bacterium]|nr:hypothetical protein [Planctomycetota bacterium]
MCARAIIGYTLIWCVWGGSSVLGDELFISDGNGTFTIDPLGGSTEFSGLGALTMDFCGCCWAKGASGDTDGDGVCDADDNCADDPNPFQSDVDGDGAGDLCDICPADPQDECEPDGSTAEEITADEGGTVQTPDGAVTIEIDPGDLAEDTTISVNQLEQNSNNSEVDLFLGGSPGVGAAVAQYDLEPDGLKFESPVTLTIVLDVSSLNFNQRNNLDIYILEDGVFVDQDANCMVDPNPSPPGSCGSPDPNCIATCIVEVEHFTTFAMVAPLDSDNDGVPDHFPPDQDNCPDHPNPDQADCDDDGVGDACTIAECVDEPDCDDCNGNDIPDGCDIGSGESADENDNGIPDECDCPADFDGSGNVGASDLAILLGSWGPCAGCPADFDDDGDVDAADLANLLGAWGPCE